jgi:quinolinate synthase
VHERFSVTQIIKLKEKYPDAVVIAHLECKAPVLAAADVKGSTATMLNYAQQSDKKQFIVATEAGILHEMQRTCPDKEFIPVPPEISESGLECSCNECQYMKMNTLEKVYNCLKDENPQIEIDPKIAKDAVKPIERMLELS